MSSKGINVGEFTNLYLNEGYTAQQLRAKYKVRTQTVLDLTYKISEGLPRSVKNWQRKLTKYQVTKILIERMRDGARIIDLAERYKVSESNVSNICAGRHWKHVFQGAKKKYNLEILSIKT